MGPDRGERGGSMTGEEQDDLLTQSLLLDEIGQSVIGMDSHWRVTYWNRASERLYGFSASEVLGMTPLDLGIVGNSTQPGQGRPVRRSRSG